ncbi:sensor histidine kinase [Brassicibacter mesophilus]|uniref:sensor histidine kinase n=1 Tax=Brassicibacter mesophilus TaxID=745119 RepID=UPI003D24CE11
MPNLHISYIKESICGLCRNIPDKYKKEFSEEILEANLIKEGKISIILLFLNILLIIFDCTFLIDEWSYRPAYKYLFYSHVCIVVFLSLFILLFHLRNKTIFTRISCFTRILELGCIVINLMWCVFLSVNAQLIHNQISAYIIGVFYVASALTINPFYSLIIYVSTYLFFIIGLLRVQDDPAHLIGNIVNSLFILILAFTISKFRYNAYITDFINRKIIRENNKDLDNFAKELEYMVEKRTVELTEANERLIKEINMRHEIELQAMKARLLCEEKTRILNEALEYDKLRTSFFANISHELKTPLNVIYSTQQMLAKILIDDKSKYDEYKASKYINLIKQNCYRLVRLIGNLIDITKIDAGYFDVNFGNYDIVKLVEDIALSVAEYAENKNINLIFDTEIEENLIACDPDRIERIILNLLSNAIKFTPKDGCIYVNVHTSIDYVDISVKDTGIGIPKDVQDIIFGRFIQADNKNKDVKEGSGIGLALVKSLVEMHGGYISLISDIGKGSEFIIHLPNHILEVSDTEKTDSDYYRDQKIENINIEFSDIYS